MYMQIPENLAYFQMFDFFPINIQFWLSGEDWLLQGFRKMS